MASKRNRTLIRHYGGEVLPFRKLPFPARLSIAHYMAIDGEAWDTPWEPSSPFYPAEELRKMMPFFLKHYGGQRFGMVNIPTQALVDAIMLDEAYIAGNWPSFDDYHDWYVDGVDMPKHSKTQRWPVILSTTDDETLQDGWHRLHDYYRHDARLIPAVYYP